jgi:hypothetical protein
MQWQLNCRWKQWRAKSEIIFESFITFITYPSNHFIIVIRNLKQLEQLK